ncbi:hypothetical protein GCM10017784_27970 [Deinococcus indicus]|nr:hypothetical protein GCM10017784_27970 [Deinococcus indicus]
MVSASILLLYSSARGQTRRVCHTLAASHPDIELVELTPDPPAWPGRYEAVLFASPTYGQGGLHHVWTTHLPQLVEAFTPSPPRLGGLLVLGDQRYHARTFAGAVTAFEPYLRGTALAPLLDRICVLDPRQDRAWEQRCASWVEAIIQDSRGATYDHDRFDRSVGG